MSAKRGSRSDTPFKEDEERVAPRRIFCLGVLAFTDLHESNYGTRLSLRKREGRREERGERERGREHSPT